jgi:hypothetical protein
LSLLNLGVCAATVKDKAAAAIIKTMFFIKIIMYIKKVYP